MIKFAADHGVGIVSITDHDNVKGLKEAADAARAADLKLIVGTEVSTTWHGKPIHFTVYGFKLDDRNFLDFLDRQCEKRRSYFADKVEAVAPGLAEEFLSENKAFAGNNITGNFLVRRGIFSDLETAGSALASVKVADRYVSPEEAIAAAKSAGAVICLAHPLAPKISLKRIDPSPEAQKKLVAELKGFGLDGVECYQSSHSKEDTDYALEIASDLRLLVSSGSDWHGPIEVLGEGMKAYIPFYAPFPGALQTPPAAVAGLLERLGMAVDNA
jgi:hypothetical protein